jgi:hypothetical protein
VQSAATITPSDSKEVGSVNKAGVALVVAAAAACSQPPRDGTSQAVTATPPVGDVSYLSTAIVSPSHELSSGLDEKVRAQLAGALSPMGDFSHMMTVRQLVDLHAYLRSVKQQTLS